MNDPLLKEKLNPIYIDSCYEIVRENCDFYCLSFNHPERTANMKARFDALGLPLHVFEGIPITDERIADNTMRKTPTAVKRLWSVTYGHLTNIQSFYQNGKAFGIFCENDVVINKNIPFFLPDIMSEFHEMKLDILLLGYMTTYDLKEWMEGYSIKKEYPGKPYKYLNYPDHQWGIHGIMISHEGAKKILDSFMNRADDYINHESNFSPDWTLSKFGNRALISPMFIVENGEDGMDHYGDEIQYQFHLNTYKHNFVPGVFI